MDTWLSLGGNKEIHSKCEFQSLTLLTAPPACHSLTLTLVSLEIQPVDDVWGLNNVTFDPGD